MIIGIHGGCDYIDGCVSRMPAGGHEGKGDVLDLGLRKVILQGGWTREASWFRGTLSWREAGRGETWRAFRDVAFDVGVICRSCGSRFVSQREPSRVSTVSHARQEFFEVP